MQDLYLLEHANNMLNLLNLVTKCKIITVITLKCTKKYAESTKPGHQMHDYSTKIGPCKIMR